MAMLSSYQRAYQRSPESLWYANRPWSNAAHLLCLAEMQQALLELSCACASCSALRMEDKEWPLQRGRRTRLRILSHTRTLATFQSDQVEMVSQWAQYASQITSQTTAKRACPSLPEMKTFISNDISCKKKKNEEMHWPASGFHQTTQMFTNDARGTGCLACIAHNEQLHNAVVHISGKQSQCARKLRAYQQEKQPSTLSNSCHQHCLTAISNTV